MKNLKVLIILVLSLAVVVSFIGCNSSTDTSESSDATPTTVGSIDELKDRSTEKLKNPDVKILLWYPVDEYHEQMFSEFEEKFDANVIVVETTWEHMRTALITGTATGDATDLALLYDMYNPSQNVFQALDDYFDLNDAHWDKSKMENFQWQGKYYAVATRESAALQLIYYNKTMIENFGLEDPLELDAKDEWTWSKFKEMNLALTVDITNDGMLDNWGFSTGGKDLLPFLMANDNKFIVYNEAGHPVVNFNDPAMIAPLEFIQDFRNNTNAIGDGSFFGGTAAFLSGELGTLERINDADFRDEWDFIRIPYGPNNTRKASSCYITGWGLPNGSKNPDGGARLRRFMTEFEFDDGNEPFLTEEQVDRLDSYYDEVNSENYSFGNIGSTLFWDLWNYINAYDRSISTTLDELRPLWQAEIDRVMASKGLITDGEPFEGMDVIDFEDGTLGIIKGNMVSVTDNPDYVIDGQYSMLIEPEPGSHVIFEVDKSQLKIEPGHRYNVKFDYKIIEPLPRGGRFSLSFRYGTNGYIGTQLFTEKESGTFNAKMDVFEDLGEYYFEMQVTNGSMISIDNFEITTIETN